MLEGLPSSTPAVQRLNGFKDGVKQNPKIKVVAEQAADWLPDKAQTAFSAMLQANPDIKVVYASNDMMAAGSHLAAKGAGKSGQDRDHRHRRAAGAGRRRARRRRKANGRRRSPIRRARPESIDIAKKILLDCADKVDTVVTVPTTAITPENAKSMMGN